MDEIKAFVNTVIGCFSRMESRLEEDQKLPSQEVLEDVCHVLLNVSTLREELRYPSFRVCFIHPDSELLKVYIYSHSVFFEKPIDFNTKELHRLAPALNADISYLMLDTSTPDYKIIGINASYTAWESIMVRATQSGNRMPKIPNIYLKGPGEMDACLGETALVRYRSGASEFSRTDAFISTPIADELRNGSSISEEDRLKVLYRILWKAKEYQHGGHLFIVPSEEACAGYLQIKYRIPSPFAFGSRQKLLNYPHVDFDKTVITYADTLARFTAVDGAVVLNKDLDLLGFGAEAIISNLDHEMPHIRFIGADNKEKTSRKFNDHGMRHRVCYRFCNYVKNSVAIVISQDGSVEGCTKKDDKVIVYDNIALPLI